MLSWLEIDRSALVSNIRQFQRLVGKKKICLVIKANAYGHGLIGVAKIISETSRQIWLGVNSIDEAMALRSTLRRAHGINGNGINPHTKNFGVGVKNPILILGYVPLGWLKEAVVIGARLTIYNLETIRELGRLKKKVFVHLKAETGTGRQGVLKESILDFAREIEKYPNIRLEGLSTHFANIEDTTNHAYAQKQLKNFKEIAALLKKNRIKISIKHTACTAATILFPETYFEMVRVGIGLYGLWPSKETLISARQQRKEIVLKPALAWKTKIAQIKKLPAGSCISYGCTEKLTRDSLVAIIPVGYSDGYDRKLSSIGNVLVRGQRAKALGRICMNMFIVDVTNIEDVQVEDEVVLLGRQGEEEITVEEIAGKIGTINYEVISRINPLLERRYI